MKTVDMTGLSGGGGSGSATPRGHLNALKHYFRGVKAAAFTLAEVLITLGIIGVVAAMTLPTLVTKYKKVQTVSQLKKTYSILNQALDRAKVEYGTDVNNWYLPEGSTVYKSAYFSEKYLIPYLKVIVKNCSEKSSGACYYMLANLSGASSGYSYKNMYTFITADGAVIGVHAFTDTRDTPILRVQMYIDINGRKSPNIMGIDGFIIELGGINSGDKNKFLPYAYSSRYGRWGYIGKDGNGDKTVCNIEYGTGARCFALIMHDGWEIKEDYPWR